MTASIKEQYEAAHPQETPERKANLLSSRYPQGYRPDSEEPWIAVGADLLRFLSSMITPNPATNDHFKTGHHEVTETQVV